MQRAHEEMAIYLVKLTVLDHFFCRHDRDRSYGLPASPEPGVQNEIKDVAHAKVVRRKGDRRKAVIAQSTP